MNERNNDPPDKGGDAFWQGVAVVAVVIVAIAVFLIVVLVTTPQV